MDEREEREKWMKEYQKDPGGTMWANLRLLQVQINELRAILEVSTQGICVGTLKGQAQRCSYQHLRTSRTCNTSYLHMR